MVLFLFILLAALNALWAVVPNCEQGAVETIQGGCVILVKNPLAYRIVVLVGNHGQWPNTGLDNVGDGGSQATSSLQDAYQ